MLHFRKQQSHETQSVTMARVWTAHFQFLTWPESGLGISGSWPLIQELKTRGHIDVQKCQGGLYGSKVVAQSRKNVLSRLTTAT